MVRGVFKVLVFLTSVLLVAGCLGYLLKEELTAHRIEQVLMHRLELSGEKRRVYQEATALLEKDPAALRKKTRTLLTRAGTLEKKLSLMCRFGNNPKAYKHLHHRLVKVEQAMECDRLKVALLKRIRGGKLPLVDAINYLTLEVLS